MKLPSWTGQRRDALWRRAAACGGSTPPPSTSDPGGGSASAFPATNGSAGIRRPPTPAELATFRYVAVRRRQSRRAGRRLVRRLERQPFACSSRMPPMTPGAHTIELASFVVDNGMRDRKRPIGRAARDGDRGDGRCPLAAVATPSTRLLTTTDGAELRLDVLPEELQAPTALAIAPDGRVFVAEREGRVRILRESAPSIRMPATHRSTKCSTTSAGEGGLARARARRGIRADAVCSTRVYTVRLPRRARRFRLVRYREVDGRLGERAVLLDGIPAARAARGALGVGPDGRLYVAFDAGACHRTRPRRWRRTAARCCVSIPTARRRRTSRQAARCSRADFQSPRGLDWHPATGALWVADVKRRDVEELRVVDPGGAVGRPRATRIPLPGGTGAAAAGLLSRHAAAGVDGRSLRRGRRGRHLLRLRFDKRDPARLVVERAAAAGRGRSDPAVVGRGQTASSTSRPTMPCCGWGRGNRSRLLRLPGSAEHSDPSRSAASSMILPEP